MDVLRSDGRQCQTLNEQMTKKTLNAIVQAMNEEM